MKIDMNREDLERPFLFDGVYTAVSEATYDLSLSGLPVRCFDLKCMACKMMQLPAGSPPLCTLEFIMGDFLLYAVEMVRPRVFL